MFISFGGYRVWAELVVRQTPLCSSFGSVSGGTLSARERKRADRLFHANSGEGGSNSKSAEEKTPVLLQELRKLELSERVLQRTLAAVLQAGVLRRLPAGEQPDDGAESADVFVINEEFRAAQPLVNLRKSAPPVAQPEEATRGGRNEGVSAGALLRSSNCRATTSCTRPRRRSSAC